MIFSHLKVGYGNIYITYILCFPFSYGDYHYYWEGHHVYTTQKPDKCDYQIIDKDKELRNVSCFQIFSFLTYFPTIADNIRKWHKTSNYHLWMCRVYLLLWIGMLYWFKSVRGRVSINCSESSYSLTSDYF